MTSFFPLRFTAGVTNALTKKPAKSRRLIDRLQPPSPTPLPVGDHAAQLPVLSQAHHRITELLALATPKSEAEQRAFAVLQRASVAVGLGVAGIFFFPLKIVAVLYLTEPLLGLFKAGYRSLADQRRVNSEVLNSASILGMLAGGFFFSLTLNAWFLMLVRWLAIKTEDHSKQGIIDLFGQQIRSVWVLVDGVEVEVPVEEVQAGHLIMIHAGQMVPMDGVIVEGHASIDQRMLTGEAQPAEKGPGDLVLAATVMLAGRICVQVQKTGEATTAAQIGRILTETTDYKTNLVPRARAHNDRMALPFLLLGAFSLPFLGLDRALGLTLTTPGYRMILYGPLSMLSYLHLAAQQGILIKDGRCLELLQDVNTVVFDKTGTLTLEQPHVCAIHACPGFSQSKVLTFAATAETKQSHPIALAILEAAAAQGITPAAIQDAAYEIGYGIAVKVEEQTIRVGSRRFMDLHAIELPPAIQTLQTEAHKAGHSLVLVAVDGALAGAITLQPTLRPEVKTIVSQLRARNLQLYIISGDHDAPTRHLAEDLGMDGYFAEVLPEAKADLVKQLQAQGRNVCFVGDGINDSIALKTANVSISLRGATTIATDTAQIVLMSGNLAQLPNIFGVADEFTANMRVNFLAATIPSIVIISGVLLFGWGLLTGTLLNQLSVPFALYNTVRPLLTAQHQVQAAATPALAPPLPSPPAG
ncbi:MAG: heavy metal translocating P-type ATPase [Caldilineaceae bacterium]